MLQFAFTKILLLQSGEWIAGEQGRRQKTMRTGISIGLVGMDEISDGEAGSKHVNGFSHA